MSLWNHPRLTAALCTVAVLGCAAAPAVFLAAADAASLGRVETVADPYVAPTPTADDYYILRQLAARSRNAESEREQRPAEVLTAPKMYIGASASLQSMQYADSAAAEAAGNALRQLAETQQQLDAARPDADACQRIVDAAADAMDGFCAVLRANLRAAALDAELFDTVTRRARTAARGMLDTLAACAPDGWADEDEEDDF